MTELLTAAQMRAIEAAAIASGAVTGLELMERAGRGVVEAIFAEWPELRATSHRAVVLCGPGNNGGDGFVVARLLKEWGWEVEVFLYGDPERLPPDARVNYERWVGMGEVGDLIAFNAWSQDYDLGIDAVFGTGLTRPIDLDVGNKINTIGALPRVVAIDLPSGCCSDSGRILAVAGEPKNDRSPRCHLTVTFQFRKLGHFTASGPDRCGKVVVTDIGLDEVAAIRRLKGKYDQETQQRPNEAVLVELLQGKAYHADFMPGWSPFSKTSDEHKYSHGHALILSGPSGRGGAARLAARGALRIGAGVVTVGCPSEALAENAARLDAVMLRVVEDGAALGAVLEDGRIGVVCLGPGLGTGFGNGCRCADNPVARRGVVWGAASGLRADAAWRGVCAVVPGYCGKAGGTCGDGACLFQGGCDAGGRCSCGVRGAVQGGGYGDCGTRWALCGEFGAV